jgi:hypothetical protein
VRQQPHIRKAIAAIDDDNWQPLDDYPDDGEAQIAETTLGAGQRLIVRRTRLLGAQAELWPDWRHFAFLTNRSEPLALVESEQIRWSASTARSADGPILAIFPQRRLGDPPRRRRADRAERLVAGLAPLQPS